MIRYIGTFIEMILTYYKKNMIIINTFLILFILFFILCNIKFSYDEMMKEFQQMRNEIGYCLPNNKRYFETDDDSEEVISEEEDIIKVYICKGGRCFHNKKECQHLINDYISLKIKKSYVYKMLCKSCK